jgi:hypothetical protein
MQEIFEFRLFEKLASQHLSSNDGEVLGPITRKIKCQANDELYQRLGKLTRDLKARKELLLSSWNVVRRYTSAELAAATCFHLIITATFEPAGEECDTEFDESAACPHCGSGAKQTSDLRLDLRKAPRNKDIARTIADEWIVSQRLAERIVDAGLSGFDLRPVHHKARYEDDPLDLAKIPAGQALIRRAEEAGAPPVSGKFYVWLNRAENRQLMEQAWLENAERRRRQTEQRRTQLPVWHQLSVSDSLARIVPPTRFGVNPFNEDASGEFRCPSGDLLGLNLLSEISVDLQNSTASDIFFSSQFMGLRQGLLRPRRAILVSPKFRQVFLTEGFKGATFDVAHVM